MTNPFQNPAPARLTDADFIAAARAYSMKPWHPAAIAEVESRGAGYHPSGEPKILFEAHWFRRLTKGRFDATHPTISNRNPKGLYKGGLAEYSRLQEALALDETAALQSASWGMFQVMGFNHKLCGFDTVQAFVRRHVDGGEPAQLDACMRFCANRGLLDKMRQGDIDGFSAGYNGKDYKLGGYDVKTRAALAKHEARFRKMWVA